MGAPPAVIVHAEPAVVFGTCGPVVVMIWRGVPTLARLRAGTDVVRNHAEACGAKVGVVSIVEHGAPIPGPAERSALARDMEEIAPLIVGASFVAEGVGPWTKLAIEAASMIDGLRRRRSREKLCVATDEAVAWMIARLTEHGLEGSPTRDELTAAIATLRARPTAG